MRVTILLQEIDGQQNKTKIDRMSLGKLPTLSESKVLSQNLPCSVVSKSM